MPSRPTAAAAALLLLLLNGASAASSPSVTLDAGTVQGGICSGQSGAAYFKAIPFAQPPVKELRFADPKAAADKFPGGTLDGTKDPDSCIQFGEEFKEQGPTSEDCLYLNVWAPANATKSSGLPVRVWLYGGSNSDGGIADPLYDGCAVAAADAIQVSINYRLGPLGFLRSSGFGGNQGLQDALMGLQWVQDNIESFGGDTKKVMLHGQSAGALDAFLIATLPQAPKLISSAIFESGGGRDATLPKAVEQISTSFAQDLKCDAGDSSCLQGKSVDDLQTAYSGLAEFKAKKLPAVGVGNFSEPSFAPCIDGKVITSQPSVQGTRVPSVFGSASREGALFALAQYATAKNPAAAATSDDYDQFLQENFGEASTIIKKYYPLSAFNSTPYPPFFAIAKVMTDADYFCSAHRGLVTAAKNGIPVWTYLFDHSPKCIWIPGIPEAALPLLGPTHTSEIPFVFGETSSLPGPNGTCEMSDDEKKISSFMLNAWTAMARDQKPASDSDWAAWSAQSSMGLNIENSTSSGFINYTACELWDKIHQAAISGSSSGNSTSGGGSGGSGGSNGTSSPSGPGAASGSSAPTGAASRLLQGVPALLLLAAALPILF